MSTLAIITCVLLGALAGGMLRMTRISFDYLIYGFYGIGFAFGLKWLASVTEAEPVVEQGATHSHMMESLGIFIVCAFCAYVVPLRRVSFPNIEELSFPSFRTFVDWGAGVTQKRSRRTHGITPGQRIYFETAIKFGALIAVADGREEPREYAALLSFFQIDTTEFPEARQLYRQQISNPQTMSAILKPFILEFGTGSAICETFLMGMCQIAKADGQAHRSEIARIRLAGDRLGINSFDISRILMSAGLIDNNPEDYFDAFERHQRASGNYQRQQSRQREQARQARAYPSSEREKHLATLGLSNGAKAAEIKSAYRALARKYHPDKLASQNLPETEMARAEAMMVKINQAYEYLK